MILRPLPVFFLIVFSLNIFADKIKDNFTMRSALPVDKNISSYYLNFPLYF